MWIFQCLAAAGPHAVLCWGLWPLLPAVDLLADHLQLSESLGSLPRAKPPKLVLSSVDLPRQGSAETSVRVFGLQGDPRTLVFASGKLLAPALAPVSLLAHDHDGPGAQCWGADPGWADGCARLLQGKQKYTLPLYHAMMRGGEAARALAKETFAATASQLHSNVVHYVQQIVAPTGT